MGEQNNPEIHKKSMSGLLACDFYSGRKKGNSLIGDWESFDIKDTWPRVIDEGTREKVENDPEIVELKKAVNKNEKSVVKLEIAMRRKALGIFIPVIKGIEAFDPKGKALNTLSDDQVRAVKLIEAAMFLATGSGPKYWPISTYELAKKSGEEKVAYISTQFEANSKQNK